MSLSISLTVPQDAHSKRPGMLPIGQQHPSQLQTSGAATTAKERLDLGQLLFLGERLQEGRFDAEQFPHPTPHTGISRVSFVIIGLKFSDLWTARASSWDFPQQLRKSKRN